MRLLLALVLLVVARPVHAQSFTVSHSGYLLDAGDGAVNATVPMSFALWDDATGGGSAWSSGACSVVVSAGYYTVSLGGTGPGSCGTGLGVTHLPAGAARWLEITANGIVLQPRQALFAAPSAQTSADTVALRNTLSAVGTVNTSGNPVDWSQLKNVPASVANGTTPWTGATLAAGSGLTGNGTTGNGLALATTGVTAGNYGFSSITVDAQGRVTSAATGTNGSTLTNLNASNLATGTVPSAVVAGTYSNALDLSNTGNTLRGTFIGDGSGLTGIGANSIGAGTHVRTVLTTPGTTTWTKPAGVSLVYVTLVGGGGGGGGSNSGAAFAGGGGGGGGRSIIREPVVVSANVSVTVGAGGTGGPGHGNNGQPGGASSFGSLTAIGGSGGLGSAVNNGGAGAASTGGAAGGSGGVGGAGSAGASEYLPCTGVAAFECVNGGAGGGGGYGVSGSGYAGAAGGSARWVPGGAGGVWSGNVNGNDGGGGGGGASAFGTGGQGCMYAIAAAVPQGYGGGGGGGCLKGADGAVIIEYWQ